MLICAHYWVFEVEKSGATVLFEEANRGSNNVGVVINPVRLTNLKEFGSPELVASKIIQAEKRKVRILNHHFQDTIILKRNPQF